MVVYLNHASKLDYLKREVFTKLSQEQSIPSNMQITLAFSRDIIWQESIPLNPQQATFTSTSKARIGSITKQITAALILQLVDAGKLKLTQPIADFFDDSETENDRHLAQSVTIHQMLSHTSGYDSKRHLVAPAGEKFIYVNWSYKYLGKISEILTGLTFRQQCQKLFAQEKIMQTYVPTALSTEQAMSEDSALIGSYRWQENGDYIDSNPTFDETGAPAGGLISPATDLVAWNQSLYKSQVISPYLLSEMTSSFSAYNSPLYDECGYGYGLYVMQNNDCLEYAHHGLIYGFRTLLAYYPQTDISLCVFLNSDALEYDRQRAGLQPLKLIRDLVREIFIN